MNYLAKAAWKWLKGASLQIEAHHAARCQMGSITTTIYHMGNLPEGV